jgi:hypothetical protein
VIAVPGYLDALSRAADWTLPPAAETPDPQGAAAHPRPRARFEPDALDPHTGSEEYWDWAEAAEGNETPRPPPVEAATSAVPVSAPVSPPDPSATWDGPPPTASARVAARPPTGANPASGSGPSTAEPTPPFTPHGAGSQETPERPGHQPVPTRDMARGSDPSDGTDPGGPTHPTGPWSAASSGAVARPPFATLHERDPSAAGTTSPPEERGSPANVRAVAALSAPPHEGGAWPASPAEVPEPPGEPDPDDWQDTGGSAVVVEIGRIEVRLGPEPPAPPRPTREHRSAPGPSLADYLHGRSTDGGGSA